MVVIEHEQEIVGDRRRHLGHELGDHLLDCVRDLVRVRQTVTDRLAEALV
ncbi:MAG TPA: hypothetical protein PLB30_05505 [Thermoleophilia bacterium]|nr:hypothetical protein [Thermoleophilia bacterium]HQJ97989.1 hypothetical protein [Thermoleophilia bacterium]